MIFINVIINIRTKNERGDKEVIKEKKETYVARTGKLQSTPKPTIIMLLPRLLQNICLLQ